MKRIIVIDDEIEMLKSLEKILSHREEYAVSGFQDALSAIKELK